MRGLCVYDSRFSSKGHPSQELEHAAPDLKFMHRDWQDVEGSETGIPFQLVHDDGQAGEKQRQGPLMTSTKRDNVMAGVRIRVLPP